MAKLPNADNATVPPAKITHYLLSLTSKHGKAKAQFFLAFGFTIEAWETLAAALLQHARGHDVTSTRETPYGTHYSIEGVLQTPDGRNPFVRSVWKIETGKRVPSFVTAYPEDEGETT